MREDRALTRADLEQMQCATPGCAHAHGDEMYLHQACHPNAPVQVQFNRRTGLLVIECTECTRPIASVAVAEE